MPKKVMYCEYELTHKPFEFCSRRAAVRIEQNGYFCRHHAKIILRSLQHRGLIRHTEDLNVKE